MKRYFLTGLVIILPVILTIVILNFFLKILTTPFLNATQYFFHQLSDSSGLNWVTQSPDLLRFISQIFIVLFLFLLVMFIGSIGRLFIINTLFEIGDRILHAIPFANKIYKATQDVMTNVFSEDKPSFSKAVLIPFPHKNSQAIGFITREDNLQIADLPQEFVPVFLPGTPNPMMGFMLLVPKQSILPLDLTLEEAVKFVVSCGVIYKGKKETTSS